MDVVARHGRKAGVDRRRLGRDVRRLFTQWALQGKWN